MNRKVLLVSLFSVALLAACTSRGATPTSDGSSEEGSSANPSSSQTTGTAQKVFTFKGFDFTAGTNFGLEAKKAELLAFLNSNEPGFITSISVSNVYAQADGNPEQTLCIGTASQAGSLVLNCKYNIVALDFKIQGYYKNDTYNGVYRMDTDSQITIAGTTYSMPNEATTGTGPTEERTEHLDLTASTKALTIANSSDHQRAFLNELTVTYIA